jgi:hypothetical protein
VAFGLDPSFETYVADYAAPVYHYPAVALELDSSVVVFAFVVIDEDGQVTVQCRAIADG